MKESNGKTIALVALAISVVGLGVGFASFTKTLTIKPTATVKPTDDTFNVKFTSNGGKVSATATTGATGDDATVTDTTVEGIKANFTAPGQSVSYTIPVLNDGEYVAYLNSINFGNGVSCTAGTSNTLVAEACKGIEVSVKVGTDTAVTATTSNITGHKLANTTNSNTENAVVTISYKEGSARADQDFEVAIDAITLTYGTAD